MWREEENVCCQEIDAVLKKNLEAVDIEKPPKEPPKCIVDHPGFQVVRLNYWVL